MRDKIYIPYNLIEKAINEGWERPLAYWCRMKSLYKNNTHYNYSLKSLSKRLRCNHESLRKQLPALEIANIFHHHSGNVTFSGWAHLREMFGERVVPVAISRKKSISEQITILRGEIYRDNTAKQEYKMQKSRVIKCQTNIFCQPGENARGRASATYIGLSGKSLGRMVGKSQSTGNRAKLTLQRMGKLKATPMYAVVARNVPLDVFLRMKANGDIWAAAKWSNGDVLRRHRDKIEFLDSHCSITNSNVYNTNSTIRKETTGENTIALTGCSQKIDYGKWIKV